MRATLQYEPLAPETRSFRVLKLHAGHWPMTIRCTLEHCQLPVDDEDAYEPLSYCWGGGKWLYKRHISVNGCTVPVTKNLYTALVEFRLRDKPRRLWVDAICINQRDNAEKGSQVQMMKDIYENGSKTLVWIGTLLFPAATRFTYSYLSTLEDGIPAQSIQAGFVLLGLFQAVYFSRIWIVQEVVVSRNVDICFGFTRIPWEALEKCLLNYGSTPTLEERFSILRVANISRTRQMFQDGQGMGILSLFAEHREAMATDKRDKLYGLLGIMDPGYMEALNLVPDYGPTNSAQSLFLRIAKAYIEHFRVVDIFCAAGTKSRKPGTLHLPTWAPDWSQKARTISLTQLPHGGLAATGWSRTDPRWEADDCRLGVSGQIIDKIKIVSMGAPDLPGSLALDRQEYPMRPMFWRYCRIRCHFWNVESGRVNAAKCWWDEIAMPNCNKTYMTGEAFETAYWKTFVAGDDGYGDLAKDEFGDVWTKFKATKRGHSAPAKLVTYVQWRRARGEAHLINVHALWGRAMFITEKGYIGLGPKDAKPGDCVALIEGGPTPFILRRSGGAFELLGDSYVHGIMGGELYDKEKCGRMWLV